MMGRVGISLRQGPHQLAQKCTSAQWPRALARSNAFPSAFFNLSAGAGLGVKASRPDGGVAALTLVRLSIKKSSKKLIHADADKPTQFSGR